MTFTDPLLKDLKGMFSFGYVSYLIKLHRTKFFIGILITSREYSYIDFNGITFPRR